MMSEYFHVIVDHAGSFSAFRWHVDKLEFKANNQPNRFQFYDRSFRRVPTPSEQALIDYKKEVEARKNAAVQLTTVS